MTFRQILSTHHHRSVVLAFFASLAVPAQSAPALRFASDLPPEKVHLLQSDLQRLRQLHNSPLPSPLAQTMGVLSADQLRAWLFERVHFIVSEEFSLESSALIVRNNFQYPQTGLPEIPETPAKEPDQNTHGQKQAVQTLMVNITPIIYVFGKTHGVLAGLKIPGQGTVPVTSPRAGVIQLGGGLFSDGWMHAHRQSLNDVEFSNIRLAALFHEARHSDGHGQNLAFTHAICPPGHAYAGYAACDQTLNGAYTIGGLTSQFFAETCKDCSTAQTEAQRLFYVDSYSRVITHWQQKAASPESIRSLQDMLTLCENLVAPSSKNKACAGARLQLAHALAQKPQIKNAVFVDPSPERGHE